jgi:nitrite reductase/ring-hydroxylating ferredoxin subunit
VRPHKAIDLERVIARIADLDDPGCRSFTVGEGHWPLRGFVVRKGDALFGYVNHCPHAGHPLNLLPHKFFTADKSLLVCASHGALFELSTGLCVDGPCSGKSLRAVPLEIEAGYVLIAADADLERLKFNEN